MYCITSLGVAALVICLFLCADATAAITGTSVNCSTIGVYSDCAAHLHCEWCGKRNVSSPAGRCYHRGDNLTCCAAQDDPGNLCFPDSQVCSADETCYQEQVFTVAGTCTTPQCCGAELPQPCTPLCIATSSICCFPGLVCAAGSFCCGGMEGEFTCCRDGETCCANFELETRWCCPQETQCGVISGCT